MTIDQRLPLSVELPGHLVEHAPQHGDFVIALFLDHLNLKIARADPLRRPRQPPDGPRQPFGEPKPHPDRRQHQEERKAKVDEAEFEQHPPA